MIKGERGGAKTDTLIKLVLIFFISLLSFSVGTFVGKQFSDSQHRMASLEQKRSSTGDHGDEGERETASIPDGHADVKPEDALTDEDINKLSEEFAQAEAEDHKKMEGAAKPAEKSHPSKTHESTQHSKNESGKAERKVASAAERVAKDLPPSAENMKNSESRVPASLPAMVAERTVGKFTVQVSSYKTEEEAKRTAEGLKSKGYVAFYVAAPVSGVTWYRVSVGAFATRQEAIDYRSKLLTDGVATSALVQKIAQ